ncbi:radical SAM protein [uncultured Ferrimonas sp.]|uniref:B12-binding domain-containing radical SAM protein n=1 Tax=uncultured Ferrimonas sp. TaxID=432640 RepID=UPI0026329374|nr:radical SAM protein [uncultured Ferrimonas sp.]
MDIFDFEQGPIRPPSEADSLLIRTTEGCPWNKCSFCTLFKGMDFTIRPVEDIKRDIWAAKQHYGNRQFDACFLQDGDSFAMDSADLIEVLTTLKQAFPSLTKISSYGRAQTMSKKSAAELKAICEAGLNNLYCGMESGSVEVLRMVKKGITPNSILKSSLHAKAAGMQMMIFVILGLGGQRHSAEHIRATAALLNQIDPEEIRVLSLAVKPGTELDQQLQRGQFTPLSEQQMLAEQRQLLQLLDSAKGRYGNYHGINLLTELNGTLAQDRQQMISRIDRLLALPLAQQRNFILGRRLGYYRRLEDLDNSLLHDSVAAQLARLGECNEDQFQLLCHDLRRRLI